MRNKLLFVLSILSCAFVSVAQDEYKTFVEDGAWCWFSDPRSVYHKGAKEAIYTGWVDSEGNITIGMYDLKTKKQSSTIIKEKFQRDDHVDPSILFLPDGRLMTFFTRHNGGMYYTTSKKAEDISAFDDVTFLDLGSQLCYSNPVMLSEENNRIYLFYRGGKTWKPTFLYSDDLGKSWSDPVTVVAKPEANNYNRPYTKVVSDGKSTIHLAFTDGHPRDEAYNSIYYLKYEKGLWSDASGNFKVSMNDLPINQHLVPRAYDGYKGNTRAWIWDIAIDDKNNPSIVYTRLPEETKHEYFYGTWNGKEWLHSKVAPGGQDFPRDPERTKAKRNPEPHYSGGIILDHNNLNELYLSRPVEDRFEIFKYTKNGDKWNEEQITHDSKYDNVRPFVVRNMPKDHKPVVLWMENYMYIHYSNYKTGIKVKGL
ncbi:MAG: BNR-4 repeat-containing protein [Bacteroidales bacterium]